MRYTTICPLTGTQTETHTFRELSCFGAGNSLQLQFTVLRAVTPSQKNLRKIDPGLVVELGSSGAPTGEHGPTDKLRTGPFPGPSAGPLSGPLSPAEACFDGYEPEDILRNA